MAVTLEAWHQSPHDYVERRAKPFGVSLKPAVTAAGTGYYRCHHPLG